MKLINRQPPGKVSLICFSGDYSAHGSEGTSEKQKHIIHVEFIYRGFHGYNQS